jgi:hypothetical protein
MFDTHREFVSYTAKMSQEHRLSAKQVSQTISYCAFTMRHVTWCTSLSSNSFRNTIYKMYFHILPDRLKIISPPTSAQRRTQQKTHWHYIIQYHLSTMSVSMPQSEMTINELSNSSLKKLARLLRGVPSQHSLRNLTHNSTIKKIIKALPAHLRQGRTPPTYDLCSTHASLNDALMEDIWYCIGIELSTVLGEFIHPLLIAHKLTAAQELAIRQLEPVGEMFDKDFAPSKVTPALRPPISTGKKWSYQADRCTACMLARVGSDDKVLLALYAGMLAHFPSYKLASRRIDHDDLTPEALENPKSKRVRFVRYWLKECTNSDAQVRQAAELGIVMKKANKSLKFERKATKHQQNEGDWSLAGESVSVDSTPSPIGDEHRTNSSQRRPSNPFADPKLGPQPRAAGLDPHSPAETLGFNVPSPRRHYGNRKHSHESQRGLLDPESDLDSDFEEYNDSDDDDGADTVLPNDSVSMAPSHSAYPMSPLREPMPQIPDQYIPRPLQPQGRGSYASSLRRPS